MAVVPTPSLRSPPIPSSAATPGPGGGGVTTTAPASGVGGGGAPPSGVVSGGSPSPTGGTTAAAEISPTQAPRSSAVSSQPHLHIAHILTSDYVALTSPLP